VRTPFVGKCERRATGFAPESSSISARLAGPSRARRRRPPGRQKATPLRFRLEPELEGHSRLRRRIIGG